MKYSGKVSIHEADMDQTNLLDNMKKINDESRQKDTFNSVSAFFEGRESIRNDLRSVIFPIKENQEKRRPSMLASRPLDLAPVANVFEPRLTVCH